MTDKNNADCNFNGNSRADNRNILIGSAGLLRIVLFLMLAILPVGVINVGAGFLAERELLWETRHQSERARSELEALAMGWSFQRQAARVAGEFREGLHESLAINFTPDALEKHIRGRVKIFFAPPFPEHELWVFGPSRTFAGSASSSHHAGFDYALLSAPDDSSISRRVISMIFENLALRATNHVRTGDEDRRAERLIESMFGRATLTNDLAGPQRGVPTHILHHNRQFWLIWDIADPTGKAGYILLIPADAGARVAGFRLALATRPIGHSRIKSGYIRLFDDPVGDVLPNALSGSFCFSKWRKTLDGRHLLTYEKRGMPWAVSVGKYTAFTLSIPNSTHIAVTLLPAVHRSPTPVWLLLMNLLASSGIILILIRGFFIGRWPEIRLDIRFAVLYLLAAAMPLALFSVAGVLFLQERDRASLHQLQTRMQSELKAFESGKERLQSEYIAAFHRSLNDQILQSGLRSRGLAAPGLLDRIRGIFKVSSEPLPLALFAIFDANGNQIASYDTSLGRDELTGTLLICRAGLVQNLRRRMAAHNGTIPLASNTITAEERVFVDAYQSVTNSDITEEIEQNRSNPFVFTIGRETAWQLYDYFVVEGLERYALFTTWRDGDLDNQLLIRAWHEAQAAASGTTDIRFTVFRTAGNILIPVTPIDRHQSSQMQDRMRKGASEAARRSGLVVRADENATVIAFPSSRYRGVIIVAGADHDFIKSEHRRTTGWLFFLGVVSLAAIAGFGMLTARRVVQPIAELKGALDRVADGDLHVHVNRDRNDELGNLAEAFTNMISGLRERRRLSELVSGAALKALRNVDDRIGLEQSLAVRPMNGVVFISDIRGFTTLCEKHAPAEITALLNRHFTEIAAAIGAWGGVVDKFIGDAVQAFFEVSTDKIDSSPSDVERAIRASIEIMRRIRAINQERSEAGLFAYEAGIGLAGGLVMGGSLGHFGKRFDYALLGPSLKRAATLEALSKIHPSFPLVVDAGLSDKAGPFSRLLIPLAGYEQDVRVFARAPAVAQIPAPFRPTSDHLSGRSVGNVVCEAGPEEKNSFIAGISRDVKRSDDGNSLTSLFVFSIKRLIIFTVGVALLFLPFGAIYLASDENEASSFQARREEAQARNMALLQRLRTPDALQTLIEDRLETLAEEIVNALPMRSGGPTAEDMKKAGEIALKRLQASGFSPTRFVLLFRPPPSPITIIPTDTWPLLIAEGCAASETSSFQKLLAAGVVTMETGQTNSTPALASSIPELLGLRVNLRFLCRQLRGRLSPTDHDGDLQWFYWQPLYQSYASSSEPRIATDATLLSRPVTPQPRLVGNLLIMLPRSSSTKLEPDRFRAVHDDRETALALIPESPGKPIISSPRFPADLKTLLTIDGPLPEVSSNMVISEDRMRLGQPVRAIVATAISPEDNRSGVQLFKALLLVTGILGCFLWARTVFFGKDIATTLAGQLLVGLLAASLLPLATTYLLSEKFTADRVASRLREERLSLSMVFEDVERLQLLYGPAVWNRLRSWSAEPHLLAALIRASAHPSSVAGSRGRIAARAIMETAMRESRQGPLPFGINEVVVVDLHGWTMDCRWEDGKLATDAVEGIFSQTAGMIGKEFLRDMQKTSGQADEPLANAVRGEMTAAIGHSILRTSFGPDNYSDMIQSPGTPVILKGGGGQIGFNHYLIPATGEPRFVIYWFHDSVNALFDAFNRVIKARQGPFAIFGFRRIFYGLLLDPRVGNFPSLRRLARRTLAVNVPVSAVFDRGRNAILAEARTGVLNPISAMIGLAVAAPIFSEVETLQGTLMLFLAFGILATLLLAAVAAEDILKPIRSLTLGMCSIDAGSFGHRLDEMRMDELGDVMRAFNRMARGLQEREVMGRMVSREARKDVTEHGERKECVVISLGVPDFDSWYKRLTPSDLFSKLTELTEIICEAVLNEGGDVGKVLGDKWLVVFSIAGDPRAEVEAALRAIDHLRALEKMNGLPLPLAVGINRGAVIAGHLGAGESRDHTIIGDAVNTAARTESEAEKLFRDRFLMTAVVRDLVPADCEMHGKIALKGKTLPMTLYRFPALRSTGKAD
ncbi:MAG: HAMP domain-containing protein [Candidatus Riflebacteria bacterium]|nr:HAMP domain-containing protein [Candidatus Riflebacteria bacterium]